VSVDHTPREGRARRAVTVLGAVVLSCANLVAACCFAVAYGMWPEDRYDQEALDGAGLGALLTLGITVPTLVLTFVAVKWGRLSKRWYLPPAAMLALAAIRYGYLVQVYDPW
jgi:hypothetical protein